MTLQDYNDNEWYQLNIDPNPGHSKRMRLVTNIQDDNTIHAALMNWDVRTEEHTAENFCEYVNSKRERGLCTHHMYTDYQFADFLQKLGI